MIPPTLPGPDQILEAATRIGKLINHTPVVTSAYFDSITRSHLFFKCENLQKVGAFKARGATNAILTLEKQFLIRGVATHSSGNHAQALSWAASKAGIPAYIVMPSNAPVVKVNAVRDYGGKITFCKPTLEAREETLRDVMCETGATEIHPYNNERIIAGQATAALELNQEIPDLEIVMAPVGGGGLLSGTALASKFFNPKASVFGAEPEKANDAWRSFTTGQLTPSVNPETIADGLRTSLGSLTFPVILEYVDNILTVSEESIVHAMRTVWERMKLLIEPSSAVPVAALLTYPELFAGRKTGIILSGGNCDLDHLPWLP